MFKRIFLFMAVNVLVIATISILTSALGVRGYITAQGLNYESLLAFCLIYGFVGAFISLGLSRIMAKLMMGVQVIDPNTSDPRLSALVQTVHSLSRSAGLPKMPEVGIYDSPEVNAFATGPTKSRALVAVSTGLLQRMRTDEVEGVLAHEVAHIANGDMVTMTLIQGVVNAFVMFLARILAFAISTALSGNRDRDDDRGGALSPMMFSVITFVLEMILSVLGMIVVAWFSRWREFRADAAGARLGGRDRMIAALERLRSTYEIVDDGSRPAVASLKISAKRSGFLALFSTHPPLEERIARLETMTAA